MKNNHERKKSKYNSTRSTANWNGEACDHRVPGRQPFLDSRNQSNITVDYIEPGLRAAEYTSAQEGVPVSCMFLALP
ncbi:hypothetical protein E2C01_099250 [Portunus trituberculatus]|uniref:Uncharacterized protein n=1 Tax=Portunus trituberculatus TaxID=210409 RepID=A0A5B7KEF1_PORTR|nr:hypothetical protein [Portunus trituberculatus]